MYRCLAHWNQQLELNWTCMLSNTFGKMHSKVAAKCQTARSLTPVRHTIPNPHTTQPDPSMASGHIMIVCVYNAERLDPAICTRVRKICVRMSTLVFHVWDIGVFWASSKKN